MAPVSWPQIGKHQKLFDIRFLNCGKIQIANRTSFLDTCICKPDWYTFKMASKISKMSEIWLFHVSKAGLGRGKTWGSSIRARSTSHWTWGPRRPAPSERLWPHMRLPSRPSKKPDDWRLSPWGSLPWKHKQLLGTIMYFKLVERQCHPASSTSSVSFHNY